jgi:hypothetical protein
VSAIQITTSVTSFSNMAKGAMAVTLLDYSTSALSVIHEGSVVEVAGTCFRWDTPETPGTWVACTTAATAYLTCVPSGSAGTQILTAGWSSTAPTWHDVNQGWYASAGSASRVIASAYKTSNTSQNNKRLLDTSITDTFKQYADGAIDSDTTIHADGAIDSDTTILADGVITAGGGVVAGTGNATLLKKIVNIGEWNMDATSAIGVAHGLTLTKIVSISVLIRSDSDSLYKPLEFASTNGISDGCYYLDGTNVTMTRLASGGFDSSGYDATAGTVANRGYIVIEYTP